MWVKFVDYLVSISDSEWNIKIISKIHENVAVTWEDTYSVLLVELVTVSLSKRDKEWMVIH